MIVTRQWLQEFIDISDISTDDICKTLNSIGLEVDSVQKIKIPNDVVIGKVLECKKHPNADKLNICQVDIGEETVQIVCGAKNVASGQFVPVATVGCVLGNDFIIKKAKLRGVESLGMICSSTEIGLPKLNDGILILDDSIGKLIIGKELNEYKLLNDEIIEIELTANRGDCLSINGIARELGTFYNIKLNNFEKDLNYHNLSIGQVLSVDCDSKTDASLIFKAANITEMTFPLLYNIRVGIIDKYFDNKISRLLSYATHSIGVILNAYSRSSTNNNKNNQFVLNIKKEDNGFDCVYSNEKLSCIGIDIKEFDSTDEEIIIEASYVNPELLAQRVYDNNQKTGEIYYRTSRGSEPDIQKGIDYFTTLISTLGAKIFKGNESFIDEVEQTTLNINTKKVNAIIGQTVTKTKIENILTSLGFEVKISESGTLSVKVPFFRHDIKNIADVTEEIVRIIGIDNIKAKPLAIDEVNRINQTSTNLIKKTKIRTRAIACDFFECVTYVFSSKELLEKYNFEVVNPKKDILNPITNELNTFRTTLLLNLLEAASNNFKQGFKKVDFFEIGTVFDKDRNESKKIGFLSSGAKEKEDFSNSGKPQNITFFEFAQKVSNAIGKFELQPMNKITNSFIHPYQSANIIVNGKSIGYISKLHPSVADDFDLPDSFIAEIDFDKISNDLIQAVNISKYQSVRRDLSLIAPKSLEYADIKKAINNIKIEEIKQFNLVDSYTDEKLDENESLTIRFILQSTTKTLEDDEINSIMNKILETLDNKLGIGIR